MVNIGLLVDRIRWYEKEIARAAKERNADLKIVDTRKIFLDASDATEIQPEGCNTFLQRCISFFRGLYASVILENKGNTVINSYDVSRVCGDKLLTTLALARAGIPTPKTKVAFSMESAQNALDALGYPAITKPLLGSWGRLIALIKDEIAAQAILEDRVHMAETYPIHRIFYLQEKVDIPNRDIRTFVLGNEVPVGIYRVIARDNEWRTNTSRGGRAEPCEITPELEELSLAAAEAVGGGILGVDIMESPEEGLLVHEVNHTVEFQNTMRVTGVDVAGLIVDYAIEEAKR